MTQEIAKEDLGRLGVTLVEKEVKEYTHFVFEVPKSESCTNWSVYSLIDWKRARLAQQIEAIVEGQTHTVVLRKGKVKGARFFISCDGRSYTYVQ